MSRYRLHRDEPVVSQLWPDVGPDLAIRRKLFDRFPFGLAYTVIDDVVIIYAVAHLSRRPGYWKQRARD